MKTKKLIHYVFFSNDSSINIHPVLQTSLIKSNQTIKPVNENSIKNGEQQISKQVFR